MQFDFCYNVDKYIESLGDLTSMHLSDILAEHAYANKRCTAFNLTGATEAYLRYITDTAPYYPPTLSRVSATVDAQANFIIISAPGAVGKTALAMHLAHNLEALYWDLSQIRIGTNTFIGSLVQALGADGISEYLRALQTSKAMLLIDAFDEAEMISGRKMLDTFITEIQQYTSTSSSPSVILFARTGTAQFLASACSNKGIPFLHYEIDYFDAKTARDFMSGYKGERNRHLVDEYLCAFESKEYMHSNFLGYAPVLQTLAEHFSEQPNIRKTINSLNESTTISLLSAILWNLLEREQGKVVSALQQRCSHAFPEFTSWESIYTPEEQITRILALLLFNDTDFSYYSIPALPTKMIKPYHETYSAILKQHPFLRENESGTFCFAGPAFQDYILAKGLSDSVISDTAEMYLEDVCKSGYLPSALLVQFYGNFLAERPADLNHLDLLYHSFTASISANDTANLYLQEVEDCYEVTFKSNAKEIALSFCKTVEDKVTFRNLLNVNIYAPSLRIHLGGPDNHPWVSNVNITCREVSWDSKQSTLEVTDGKTSIIVAEEAFRGRTHFDIYSKGVLKISSPNLELYYDLAEYRFISNEYEGSITAETFAYLIKCIFCEFRTHGKDTLAKKADRINNVVVGKSQPKRSVLNFLIAKGIVYKDAHLYKINTDRSGEAEINFSSLASLDNLRYQELFESFKQYMHVT